MEAILGYKSDEEASNSHSLSPPGKRRRTAEPSADSSTATGSAPQTRVRGFPHVEGNYPTHTYITVPAPDHVRSNLRRLLFLARESVPGLQVGHDALSGNNQAIADVPGDYHLSLSRTVAIRYSDRDSLLAALRNSLRKTHSFALQLTELEYFANDERTRSFLALSVSEGREKVCKAIARVNRAFVQHGLQGFYDDPRPHVSIAWALGYREDALKSFIGKWQSMHEDQVGQEMVWKGQVNSIFCKVGQRIHKVWDSSSALA